MSLLLNFLFGRLARRLTGSQQFQEQLDIWRLYHLTHYYKECGGQEVKVKKPEQKARFSKQHRQVHAVVNTQVVDLLENMCRLRGDQSRLCSALPFSLEVRPSSICHPKAGKGVFVNGHAVPGSVVALFPGTVYLPTHINQLPDNNANPEDSLYMMSRHDGAVINALEYNDEHPYALGHMINHPPKGSIPNVIPFSYDAPADFPDHLTPLLPNKYFKKPSFFYSSKSRMRCLVLLTMQHVKNEELHVNYRLNPRAKLPEWYSPVDSKEDKRRWTA
eukprot:m.67611 g.67611  ORF g.67611 m.67611 type:complete len:275 (+) comp35456_c0_seq4:67-891(+)